MTQEVDDIKTATAALLDAVPPALELIQAEVAAILKGGSGLPDAEKASLEASAKAITDTAATITQAVADAKAALNPPAPPEAPAA